MENLYTKENIIKFLKICLNTNTYREFSELISDIDFVNNVDVNKGSPTLVNEERCVDALSVFSKKFFGMDWNTFGKEYLEKLWSINQEERLKLFA